MPKVIGVFDTDSDVSALLSSLYAQGYAEDRVHVVIPVPPADPEAPIIPVAPGGDTSGRGMMTASMGIAAESGTGNDVRSQLSPLVPDQSLDFYDNAVRKGGSVVVVEAPTDDVAWVQSLMKQNRATSVSE